MLKYNSSFIKNMPKRTIRLVAILILAAALIIAAFSLYRHYSSPNDPMAAFARCLKRRGVDFYGSYRCDACQHQKTLFGSGASALPYVECLTPDGQSWTSVCRKKNIEYYPTWTFKDGSQLEGEQPLDLLAQRTGCSLPE